jgi:hypothetical protein
LAHFHCSASLRHGVFLLCPEPPAKRFRAFSFTDFSGEYAFYFSTGMGTEPGLLDLNTGEPRYFAMGYLRRIQPLRPQ